jgi:hypothetical protein
MGLFAAVILAVALVALSVFIGERRKKTQMAAGKIIKRNDDFYEQTHTFTTRVASLADVGGAINQAVLAEVKVSFESNYSRGFIRFRASNLSGMFNASLQAAGQSGGAYFYRFSLENWNENKIGVPRVVGANELLTAIEKAFILLDPDTAVQRQRNEIKSKSSFF